MSFPPSDSRFKSDAASEPNQHKMDHTADDFRFRGGRAINAGETAKANSPRPTGFTPFTEGPYLPRRQSGRAARWTPTSGARAAAGLCVREQAEFQAPTPGRASPRPSLHYMKIF
eukprot:2201452-Pleurochrysis_carterae.AAC.1